MFALIAQAQSLAQQTVVPKHWWPADSRGTKDSSSWDDDCQKNVDGCKRHPEPSTSSWIVGTPSAVGAEAAEHI